jgi:hypothetical protein
MDARSGDAQLLARQASLQAEADSVLDDLDLMAILGRLGRPLRTGSSALGLMVVRDIDVTTLCPDLDPSDVFGLAAPLVTHPRVRKVGFRNDTGRWKTNPAYPDGLYWGVDYVGDDDAVWNLDLWFLRQGTTQFDLEHMATLPARLTDETRVAILRIKTALAEASSPRPPSYEVYEAVLDHGVRSPEEFARYRAGSGDS